MVDGKGSYSNTVCQKGHLQLASASSQCQSKGAQLEVLLGSHAWEHPANDEAGLEELRKLGNPWAAVHSTPQTKVNVSISF